MSRARKTTGRVTFVGAGPGDPGLLTVRAAEALRSAALILLVCSSITWAGLRPRTCRARAS